MCSETFLRLPEEKRTRFLDAAWNEFSRVPFSEASINKIVRQARIPRGSFYQYFSDKEELFFHLLGGMLEHFLDEYSKVLSLHHGDIFQTQADCYDRVLTEQDLDPLFARGITLLRLNPTFLLDHFVQKIPAYVIWEAVRGHIDHGMFQNEDTEKQAFVMSLGVLVIALSASMTWPERTEVNRRELRQRLALLKNGSLAETPREVQL